MNDEPDKDAASDDEKSADPLAAILAALKSINPKLDLPADKIVTAPLAYEALRDAADQLASRLKSTLDENSRTLITADADLAAASACYAEVDSAVTSLLSSADAVLNAAEPVKGMVDSATLLGLAGAIPGLLSLLSSTLTVRMSAVSANDLAAGAAVAAALISTSRKVVHQSFRLVPQGALRSNLDDLAERRQKLLRARQKERGKARIAEIDAMTKAIDDFSTAIRAIPAAGGHSLLTTALLAAPLHESGEHPITHVLLVKSEGGHTVQRVDDAIIRRDTVSVVTENAITYMLIKLPEGDLIASGTVNGVAQAQGTIDGPLVPTLGWDARRWKPVSGESDPRASGAPAGQQETSAYNAMAAARDAAT